MNNFPNQSFNQIQELNPYWSSWVCLCEAVRSKNWSRRVIRKKFDNFVNKNDYSRSDRFQLLNNLFEITKL